jgi:ankyrin repeat protein
MQNYFIFFNVKNCAIVYTMEWIHDNFLSLEAYLYQNNKKEFIIACSTGKAKYVTKLLKYKANINYIENSSKSLMHACSANHIQVVSVLLEHNSNISQIITFPLNRSNMISYLSSQINNIGLSERQIKLNQQLNSVMSENNITINQVIEMEFSSLKFEMSPLISAITSGSTEIVSMLLECNLDLNQSVNDKTPLMYACIYMNIEIVSMLLRYGVNVNKTTRHRLSPLIFAFEMGYTKIISLLLRYGAGLYYLKNNDQLPLIKACDKGFVDIALILLETGFNSSDIPTFTPLARSTMKSALMLLMHNRDITKLIKDNNHLPHVLTNIVQSFIFDKKCLDTIIKEDPFGKH